MPKTSRTLIPCAVLTFCLACTVFADEGKQGSQSLEQAKEAAMYAGVTPAQNDGVTSYALTVKDVPVNGFWSITIYRACA